MSRKKNKSTYRIMVKIKVNESKEEDLPDFGLGKGVLGYVDATIPDDTTVANTQIGLYNVYRDQLETLLECVIEKL